MAVSGKIICGPQATETAVATSAPPTCCPADGIWSDWTGWAECTGTCRSCSSTTRTRTCLTASAGCACLGLDTETQECQVVGKWNDWTITQQCNNTCGACGVMVLTRTCNSTTCGCSGATTRTQPCGLTPCTYPTPSCCSGYSAGTYQSQILCGPLPTYTENNAIQTCSVVTTTPAPTCAPGGVWSAWSAGTCNDTCGLCGNIVRTRTCQSAAA
uniref:Thrombospondin type 1 domain protein n=1 Tax=Panagrolaimus sp. JU765 TaxID=591449 RepID=A0AC34R6D1_9BILA